MYISFSPNVLSSAGNPHSPPQAAVLCRGVLVSGEARQGGLLKSPVPQVSWGTKSLKAAKSGFLRVSLCCCWDLGEPLPALRDLGGASEVPEFGALRRESQQVSPSSHTVASSEPRAGHGPRSHVQPHENHCSEQQPGRGAVTGGRQEPQPRESWPQGRAWRTEHLRHTQGGQEKCHLGQPSPPKDLPH